MNLFLQQLLNGVIIGSTYAVIAIGFALVFTVLRVINFAHPDIFMVGMFGGLLCAKYVSSNFFVVAAASALSAGLVGLILERAVLRPLRGRDALMTLIATLGVGIMLENGVAALISPDVVAFPRVISRQPIDLGAVSVSKPQIVNLIVSLISLAIVSYYVRLTPYGRATRAVAERPDVAAAFGVNVSRVSQVAVTLASMLAGCAAVSVGLLYGNAWAFIGLAYGIKGFICILIAGNRYFEGVMLVALALGILEALITGYLSSTYRDAIAFLLLIAVLYVRPNGLFGSCST